MLYMQYGILFSFRKEGKPATCNNMHEPGGAFVLSEINQSQRKTNLYGNLERAKKT